jgi:hypothetical protein
MTRTTFTAAIAAGFLAIGILVGAAGAVVVGGAGTADFAGHMRDMGSMMSMTGGPGSMMGPGSFMAPADHGAHHAAPSPAR